jgi:ferrous iron transport protein A
LGVLSGGVEESIMSNAKNLTDAQAGADFRIVSIEGGRAVRQRLFALGFHVGDKIAVQGRGPFRGPLLVTNLSTGTCLAIGRGIAKRIQVEDADVG